MTGWRDLDDVRQPLPLDDWTADRLLAGRVDPDDAPPGYAGLARALGQARGPVEAGELAGRELIVAAVTAAVADASPPIISTLPRRKSMFAKMFGTKLAAATLTTVLLATGAAAATDSLPDAVQGIVSDAADNVGLDVPDGDTDAPEFLPVVDPDGDDDGIEGDDDDADEVGDDGDDQSDDGDDADDDSGDEGAPEAGDPAEEKETPASLEGQHAHEVRDLRHSDDPEGWKDLRDSYHQEKKDSDLAGDEDDATPASEQGTDAHTERDARLAENDAAKALRDAEKAQRPADEGDDADSDDDADDDADEADDSDDEADADDDDEDGKDDDADDSDDDSDDDADEDDAPADPAV